MAGLQELRHQGPRESAFVELPEALAGLAWLCKLDSRLTRQPDWVVGIGMCSNAHKPSSSLPTALEQ
ncbi:hypothetical protein KVH24_06225 [Streptomyces olivaceus]|uniref:hypothetical protein n=1 Tax=Streptomyces olivaceus TaxID=47716 RepID=UPI001CCAB107|nr:hypothetical protein [Streptomyces olivaceus]MBZ6171633.1 hypothetical protein [Streptomyces olivaceus]MBZ6178602.1 hypothetical protein [Streptomyces olivaceus]